jgi:hypothetical protein
MAQAMLHEDYVKLARITRPQVHRLDTHTHIQKESEPCR